VLAILMVAAGLGACGDDGGDTEGTFAGGDKETFCRLASTDELAGFESLEDFDPSETGDMARLDSALQELTDAAPTAIRDDVRVVAEGVRELVDVLAGVDMDDPEALAALSERAEELESMQAEMERATANVDRYLEEECGIDPDA
jgi:hypothetical protein